MSTFKLSSALMRPTPQFEDFFNKFCKEHHAYSHASFDSLQEFKEKCKLKNCIQQATALLNFPLFRHAFLRFLEGTSTIPDTLQDDQPSTRADGFSSENINHDP
jgi:hypothetical protein